MSTNNAETRSGASSSRDGLGLTRQSEQTKGARAMLRYLVTVRYTDGRADKVTNCGADDLSRGWDNLRWALTSKPEGIAEIVINKITEQNERN